MATKKVVFEVEIKGSKQVLELQKQIKELKKQLEKTDDPTVADQLLRDLAKLEVELQKARAQAKQSQAEFIAKDQTVSSYKRLSAQLFLARERFKELAASGKASNKELQQAQNEALKLQNRLKAIDQATGNFGRNVGNYAGSLKGLFGSLRQTVATSRLLNAVPNVFNIALNAVEKLRKGVELYNETFNESFLISKQVQAATDVITKEYIKERAQLDGLITVAKNENETKERRAAAVDALQAQYPDYFKNIDRENISIGDLAAGYDAARANLVALLKEKIKNQVIEAQLADAVQKTLDAQKTAQQQQLVNALAVSDAQGLILKGFTNIQTQQAEISAATAKNAASNLEEINNAVNAVFETLEATVNDASGAFDSSTKNIETLSKTARSENTKITQNQEQEAEKRKQIIERLNKDLQDLQTQQAGAFLDIQRQLQQAIIDNIEDEQGKAIAQEKLNFELRKQERQKQFADLIAITEQQEARLIEVFGENSKEVLDFRKAAQAQILQAENAFYALSEQDATTHQNNLKAIQQDGTQAVVQTEEEALQQRLQLQNDYLSELELVALRQTDAVESQLSQGIINEQQAAAERLRIERELAAAKLQVINDTLHLEKGLTDEQKSELIKQRIDLSRPIREIDRKDSEERRKKFADTFNDVLQNVSASLNALNGLFDAISAREQQRVDEALQAQQREVEGLQERLNNAAGIEREYLEQKLERETFAAQQLAKEKERIETEAAKRNKAIGIIQAVINTALGISQAIASLPPPASYVTAAITGALGAVQIATIAAQPLATGGIVGGDITGMSVKRSNGDNVLTTLKTGEVVLNDRQQKSLGGAPTFRAIGVPGFIGGGRVSSTPAIPSLPSLSGGSGVGLEGFKEIISAFDRKTDAINSRIDNLRVLFTDETQREQDRDQKDRKQIKIAATL